MAKPADNDPVDTPIAYSSAFGTARRNVLFWGAATLLIAIGTANAREDLSLSVIMAGLTFDPKFLTVVQAS